MDEKKDAGWNPYLAGALAGVVIVLYVWIAGKYVGASTSFVRSAGMIEKPFVSGHVARTDYFKKYEPKVDWQWMFVLGILVGSLAAAVSSGSFRFKAAPDMWQARFGPGTGKRAIVAFLGGVVLALIYAFLADHFDHSIKSREDAMGHLDVPVLASVPTFKKQFIQRN